MLHFHRFENENQLTGFDAIPNRNVRLHNLAGHRSGQSTLGDVTFGDRKPPLLAKLYIAVGEVEQPPVLDIVQFNVQLPNVNLQNQ